MAICYCITAHGYGHAVRSAAIINQIPESIPVIVRSAVSEDFLEQEIERRVEYVPGRYDCGVLQKNNLDADIAATLAAYKEIAAANESNLTSEVAFLKERDVRVVVSDVASFPLRLAHEASIPGIAVGNFTWASIYDGYAASHPEAAVIAEQIRAEHRLATRSLVLAFNVTAPEMANSTDVGLVCRESQPIRPALAGYYDLDPGRPWALFYLGQGATDFDFSRLASAKRWQFAYIAEEPDKSIPAFAVAPSRFHGQDVVASCQAVIAKPGYGIAADCISSDVPLMYTPREQFAEFPPLHESLQAWGRAKCLDLEAFNHGDLESELDTLITTKATGTWDLGGAARVAGMIAQFHQK